MTIQLRQDAKFSDGSAANASVIVQALKENLKPFLGTIFEDIESIEATPDGRQIVISFDRPSPFLLEALEVTIKKPGAPTIGTGPFVLTGTSTAPEIRANNWYYLGRPVIDQIVVTNYSTARAAWAEMLRNNIDMLYEVGPDAAALMHDATTVSTFTFTRPYQYLIVLNQRLPKFRPPEVRRALNSAIDRAEIVRDGFEGQATPAFGFVWPRNWAFDSSLEAASFAPQIANQQLRPRTLRFTCLVPTDYERVALVVQRQLAAVGVTMDVEPVAPNRVAASVATPSFEALLTDVVGGSSLLRPYLLWHTGGTINPGALGNPELDSALDRIRRASSDAAYKSAVAELQKLTTIDPPAIYLAWGERARAVSKRFDVPAADSGRDILQTLRLWKPVADERTNQH